ncbi:MAG: transcription factor, partial [Halobacteriaceae archaeon]
SGKYIVRGGKSYETLYGTNQQVVDLLTDFGIVEESVDPGFEVRNIVCVVDSGRDINLQALIVLVGLENAELEPEQFPGLVYRPEEFNCIFLIFSSGKIVVTGSSNEDEIVEAVDSMLERIESLD